MGYFLPLFFGGLLLFLSLGEKSFSGLIPPQSETVVFLTGFFALFATITLISFQGYNDNHKAFDQLLKNYAPQQDNLVQNNAPVSLLDSLLDVVERLGLVTKPQQFVLAVALTDVYAKLNELVVNNILKGI